MTLKIKNNTKEQLTNVMQRLGYAFLKKDTFENQLIFQKRVYQTTYPRIHVFLQENKENITMKLHLDQKQPSYKGHTAHSGEYKGDILKIEAQRIKNSFAKPYEKSTNS